MKKIISLFMAVAMLFTLTAGLDFSASAEESAQACAHTWNSYVQYNPTCTNDGVTKYICTACGEEYTKSIPANAHVPVTYQGIPATCMQLGLTDGAVCGLCGMELSPRQIIPMKDHTWDDGVITVSPNCTEKGVKTFTCSSCGDTYEEDIAKTEHTIVIDKGYNATCTKSGVTDFSSCSVCGEIFESQDDIPAKGHDFGKNYGKDNAKCKNCKITFSEFMDKEVFPTVKPPQVKIKSAVKGKKSFAVKWARIFGVTGYQVQYSTSKKFTKKTTKTVTFEDKIDFEKAANNKKFKYISKTIKNLKGGKKYYVRVRAYNEKRYGKKSKMIYGSWSKVKTVTTKK